MFLGTYTPTLDDKGRLTLPAKFREKFAGGLMVTKGQDHSLAVYPREEFMARALKAAAVSRTSPTARAFIRHLAAGADEQRLDASGRIILSASHREYAGLTRHCVVIGSVDFLEIWDSGSWAAYQKETEAVYSAADADDVLGGLL